mmetsp:Transcript_124155/g.312560  ORF Transcript_124155/g.312560 Transcript_124155/m.312560 type:complete len:112 (-) Transcript_124155:508-843(-)
MAQQGYSLYSWELGDVTEVQQQVVYNLEGIGMNAEFRVNRCTCAPITEWVRSIPPELIIVVPTAFGLKVNFVMVFRCKKKYSVVTMVHDMLCYFPKAAEIVLCVPPGAMKH